MLPESLRKSLGAGLQKVRWYAGVLGDRFRVEAAVIKLMSESHDLQRKRDALLKQIGERVFDLRERNDLNVLTDSVVAAALKELGPLEAELEELGGMASDIDRAP